LVNMEGTCLNVFLYGVVGDAALQAIAAYTSKGEEWGLNTHFKEHGKLASLFIAGGMTTGTYALASFFSPYYGVPPYGSPSVVVLAITGLVLDVLFRTQMLMPSLRDYYKKLSPWMSIFWASFPSALMHFL
jgi:hypothetical protein